jgi:hypothetical protein
MFYCGDHRISKVALHQLIADSGFSFAKSRKMHVRLGHEVYLVAPTTDAAKTSWQPAKPAVRAAKSIKPTPAN